MGHRCVSIFDTRSSKAAPRVRSRLAEFDAMAMAVALAAIIMFIGTGGRALSLILASAQGIGFGPGKLLTTALLLNIALIIFGWRRYSELTQAMRERSRAEAEARELAETDPLTGCLNRRGFVPEGLALLDAAAASGKRCAALVFDIDNFKSVNDINGHAIGDAVIRQSVERLRACLPEGALFARLGGDEFACLFTIDASLIDHARDVAEDIIARVGRPMTVGDFTGAVTLSVGIALAEDIAKMADAGEDAGDTYATSNAVERLTYLADIAMYHAKREGRNRCVRFDVQMARARRQRQAMEAAIRRGLVDDEFEPYYEQQFDVATGRIRGFEMLARWHSPEGDIGPADFIPIAEEMGVIAELSERLITRAVRDAREWASDLTLSVNISPVQLRDPWFAQRLLKLLVAEGFPPSRLDLEITESALHGNLTDVTAQIASLKNQGIAISLDDFGTGYSSLAQLRALPFNRIKIDRSFITNMDDNDENAAIVRTISALGIGLGLPITAEGIETSAVCLQLSELGAFTGQGYLYGKPQPAGEVHAQLAKLGLLAETPTVPDISGGAGGNPPDTGVADAGRQPPAQRQG